VVRARLKQPRSSEQELNLITGAPVWLLAILVVALVAGAVEDALRLRISNITSLVVLASGICAAVIEGPSISLWQNAAVFVGILMLGTAAFAAGMLGGGDVKLLAASAIWVDLRHAVWLLVLIFLAGGVLALLYLLSRPFRAQQSKRIPYGIAIAVGAIAIIGLSRGALQQQERPLPALKIVRPSA
jgi:prepilin peptidase CpaA